ncbi:MAG: RNA methyltransferase [Nitriliruptor sp.]|nr:MAG: RNA methyltransferase [Nitriliruptor sp.]
MATPTRITDPSDDRLADFAALTDARLRKLYEHRAGVLIAEGPNPVRALVASPYPVRSLLLAEERVDQLADVVAAIDAPVYVVTRDLLYEVVRFKLHQGVLACGGRLPAAEPAEVVAGADRIALLEGLNDHENLGALFRSARGLGVGGVLLGPGCADPLYRRTVRTSMGHVLHVPHARVDHLDVAFDVLRAAGFTTVALTPDPDAVDLRDVEVADHPRIAILVGAEGPGLTGDALARSDVRIRIRMDGGVDSLNVATAAAIAFHALR